MNTATERSERSRASARFEMPRRYAAHHLLRGRLGILFAMAGGQLDLLGLTGVGLLMGIFGAGFVYWNSGET